MECCPRFLTLDTSEMMLVLAVSSVIFIFTLKFLFAKCLRQKEDYSCVGYQEEWFGKGQRPDKGVLENDTSIRPFKIQVPDEVLSDLQRRLENTRHEDSLEDVNFEYGFHSKYLQEVVNYWKNQYQWRQQEEYLNQFPHFKTRIEGIDVHFMHIKPTIPKGKKLRVFPLLIIHGWPGSFIEFYKIVPMLTSERPNHDFVFEVVCPSIPGYGFSESPHHKGFNQRATARVFVTLMKRLGHSKFYIHAGDWGSFVCLLTAKLYPYNVIGIHVNFVAIQIDFLYALKYLLVFLFPFLVSSQEYSSLFPIKKKFTVIIDASGYFHLQSTKPDSFTCGLADSPAGLAAYILEKFSLWTDINNALLPDGGLTKKFTLDELLTNVMVYWVNNNAKSSARYYKECWSDKHDYDSLPISPPCGISLGPNDALHPKFLLPKKIFKNLVSYTVLPRGGHFLAMEEPQLLADEIWKFVKSVENEHH